MTRFDMQEVIAHYGIQGQRWGIRRFQNPDGSLTPEGEERYGYGSRSKAKMYTKGLKSATNNYRRMDIVRQKAKLKMDKVTEKRDAQADATTTEDKKALRELGKLERKAQKAERDYKNTKKMAKLGKQEVERILSLANSEGYNISAKTRTRASTSGRDIIQHILYGTPAVWKTTAEEYKVRKTRYSLV